MKTGTNNTIEAQFGRVGTCVFLSSHHHVDFESNTNVQSALSLDATLEPKETEEKRVSPQNWLPPSKYSLYTRINIQSLTLR